MRLTDEQIRCFHEQGYVTVEGLLPPSRVAALDADSRDYHERFRNHTVAGMDVSWEPGTLESGAPKIQQLLHAELASPCVNELLRSDAVLDCVGSLLGPDVALFESKLLMKSARVGEAIPWHQDFDYWRDYTAAPIQVSCLIRIDEADEENGCLRVVPGSHLAGLRTHAQVQMGSVFSRDLGDQTEGGEEVVLPGPPGSAVLFSPLLLHASGPNRSARERRSMTLVYTVPGPHDHHREVLRRAEVPPTARPSFTAAEVRYFAGPGPHGGQCASSYRRRELWKLAVSRVEKAADAWIELSESSSEGESFVWLAARKPAATPLLRFDRCPGFTSNRDDARVVGGPFELTLQRECDSGSLGDRVGLLFVDSPHYFSVKNALVRLAPRLRPGTVIVFDQFYGWRSPGWRAAGAFDEFLREQGLGADHLGRADSQVAVRLTDGAATHQPRVDWAPSVQGITFDLAPELPEASEPSSRRPKRRRSRRRRRTRRLLRAPLAWIRNARERRRPPTELEQFLPLERIPRFVGDGPGHGLCPTHSRRRQLWEYTISLVEGTTSCWCEFGVGEGESLDWFALRKPRETVLFGFDSFEGIPEPWAIHPVGQWRSDVYRPNRPDVVVVEGMFDASLAREDVLARLGDRIGLLHVDCDLYSSTRSVLQGVDRLIQPGTVILFDELYGFDGWETCEARALLEYVRDRGIALEWLARSDFQVAARVLDRNGAPRTSVWAPSWRPTVPGIRLEGG